MATGLAILRGSATEAPILPASGTRGAPRTGCAGALVREAPVDDLGLAFALDHAARLLCLFAPAGAGLSHAQRNGIPDARWTALAAHRRRGGAAADGPLKPIRRLRGSLPFAAGDRRIELDLASPAQREAWRGEFRRR